MTPEEERAELAELEALEAEAEALERAAASRGGLSRARRGLLLQGPLVALLALALLLWGRGGGPAAASGAASAATAPKLAMFTAYLDRPAGASGPVDAYVTIRNGGGSDDRLVSVNTPWAASVVIVDASGHTLPWVTVPAEGSIALKPGGLHLELRNLRRAPKPHEVIQLDLTFASTGTVQTWSPLGPPGSITVEDVMHAMKWMDRLPPE
ncbi:copper chaperone PCu(A)C [Streptacidiphilus rugosus]|uniref:copper chaperone PCu(A)C n=1 Tax=Streptacidiphilus rugosus TaxID=405783 RepID=UPI0005680173|nr:copper chaperone PCu(A)C [Streptacidiphilus rugosus]